MALCEERVREIVTEMQAADRQEFVEKLKVDMNELQTTIQGTVEERLGEVLAVHIAKADELAEQLMEWRPSAKPN